MMAITATAIIKAINCAKVYGHRINFALKSSPNPMSIRVKSRKAVNIVPNFFIVGMKNMGAVFMNFDPGLGINFGKAVATNMLTLIDY